MTRGGLACLLVMSLAPVAWADDEPAGVVLALEEVPRQGIEEAAMEAGGAVWRLETLTAIPGPANIAPEEAVAEVERAYEAGDFPHCLATLTDPELEALDLLGKGHHQVVVRLFVVSGACTAAAGDNERATELFRRMYILGLGSDTVVADLRPDIAALAEAARRDVLALERVAITIATPDAVVEVDGQPACQRTPCTVRLYPGIHVLALSALGRGGRVERIEVTESVRLAPRLDPPNLEAGRLQLAAALHRGINPDSILFARGASEVFGTRVLLTLRYSDGQAHAALFDRALGDWVARQSASTDDTADAGTLLVNVIDEWRGEIEPGIPWWVWAVVGGATAIAGIATYLLLEPELSSHSFRF